MYGHQVDSEYVSELVDVGDQMLAWLIDKLVLGGIFNENSNL